MRVKICCIQNSEEANLAIRHGADMLGLVSSMPSGIGPIPESEIARIHKDLPPGVTGVLLTSQRDAGALIAQHTRTGAHVLQLCDRTSTAAIHAVRGAVPGIKLIQVIHVTTEEVIARAVAISKRVDALLLDTGAPDAEVPVLGGTGKTHNWRIDKCIRESVEVPVIMAGGLTPENVAEAVETVQPYAVDVCSGVRTDGQLDEKKLQSFLKALGR